MLSGTKSLLIVEVNSFIELFGGSGGRPEI